MGINSLDLYLDRINSEEFVFYLDKYLQITPLLAVDTDLVPLYT